MYAVLEDYFWQYNAEIGPNFERKNRANMQTEYWINQSAPQ